MSRVRVPGVERMLVMLVVMKADATGDKVSDDFLVMQGSDFRISAVLSCSFCLCD